MVLQEKHRSTIYQRLVPILGEEEAEAFMGEFPANEKDELVTKEFLRAELAEFGADLRTEMHQLASRTLVVTTGGTVTALIAGMGLAAAIS